MYSHLSQIGCLWIVACRSESAFVPVCVSRKPATYTKQDWYSTSRDQGPPVGSCSHITPPLSVVLSFLPHLAAQQSSDQRGASFLLWYTPPLSPICASIISVISSRTLASPSHLPCSLPFSQYSPASSSGFVTPSALPANLLTNLSSLHRLQWLQGLNRHLVFQSCHL